MYLGERTISRLGCFGCHTIPGFENAKPIGTPLNGWGIKSPAKLDYGHIAEYLDDQPDGRRRRPRRHRPLLPGEARRAHPLGLPLPEAAPAPELRLPEDERGPEGLGRPAPDAAVRLGQRPEGGRGGDDVRPRPDRREDRQPGTCPRSYYTPDADRRGAGVEAPEPVQLHGLPRPGDAQVHDRRRARSSRRPSPTSRPTSGSPTPTGRTTTSSEFYPKLDLRPEEDSPTLEPARRRRQGDHDRGDADRHRSRTS